MTPPFFLSSLSVVACSSPAKPRVLLPSDRFCARLLDCCSRQAPERRSEMPCECNGRSIGSLQIVRRVRPAGLREKAAIPAERLAGDERSSIAEKEFNGRGYVRGGANSAQGREARP